MLFNKIYIINLKRRSDRKEKLTNALNALELPPEIEIKWIEAVDGRDLPDSKNYNVLPFTDPNSGRAQTKGEVGCALSHHKAWSQAYEELKDDESCLILEDDVVFNPSFVKTMWRVNDQIVNQDLDLIYLGSIRVNKNYQEKEYSDLMVEPGYRYWCSSIVYSKSGLKKILDHDYLGRITPADEFIPALLNNGLPHVIDSLKSKPNLKGLALKENIVSQEFSAFQNSDTERSDSYDASLVDSKDFTVLTVGTDYNDGLKRLEKSLKTFGFPHELLGVGEIWYGGDDILNHPGAGQKVNILRTRLKQIVHEEKINPIILFLDGYDTIVLKPANEVLATYNQMNQKIIFGAEKTCWPDWKLAKQYPEAPTDWKYLNSGQFIGRAKDLLDLIEDGIDDAEDDQYYYSVKFLEGKHGISLDYNCKIFQCLSDSSDDVEADHSQSVLHNKITKTQPSVAHGNGNIDAKYFFNYIANFIANNFRKNYGHLEFHPVNNLDVFNTRILISVFDTSENPEHIYSCLDSLRYIDYPHENLAISVYSYREERRKGIVRYLAQGDFVNYESIIVTQNNLKDNDDRWLRSRNLELAESFDYNFCIDSDIYLDKTDILSDLISYQRTLVGPKIGENFWLMTNPSGWQHFCPEDELIHKHIYKGIWAVARIDKCYLLDCSVIPKIKDFFNESYNPERGTNMAFCYNLVSKGFVPYMINVDEGYGETQ